MTSLQLINHFKLTALFTIKFWYKNINAPTHPVYNHSILILAEVSYAESELITDRMEVGQISLESYLQVMGLGTSLKDKIPLKAFPLVAFQSKSHRNSSITYRLSEIQRFTVDVDANVKNCYFFHQHFADVFLWKRCCSHTFNWCFNWSLHTCFRVDPMLANLLLWSRN